MASSLLRSLERLEFNVVRSLAFAMERFSRARGEGAGESTGRPHPEIRALLALQKIAAPKGPLTLAPAARRAQMRRQARVFSGRPVPVGSVRDLTLDTAPPLAARLYSPAEPGEPAPLIVYFHGGGFVLGDLTTHDVPCRILCKESGAHVLSVDYRLAPENPFPAAVEDSVAAYDWARANAEKLGADPGRVVIAGDSAGANLATVVAQLAAKTNKPLPALQLLFYPNVERMVKRPSLELFAEGYFLTRADVDWYTEQYITKPEDLLDPRVSPLLAADLSKQSPAIIVTAGFDPLRDEGDAYAEALRAAGNEVQLFHLTGLVHGFINLGAVSNYARTSLVHVAHEARKRLSRAASAVHQVQA